MATNWQPTTRRQWYRIIGAVLVLSTIAYAGVIAGSPPIARQSAPVN